MVFAVAMRCCYALLLCVVAMRCSYALLLCVVTMYSWVLCCHQPTARRTGTTGAVRGVTSDTDLCTRLAAVSLEFRFGAY